MSIYSNDPDVRLGRQEAPSNDGGVVIFAPARGSTAVLPAGFPLRAATFIRRGGHLVIRASGHPDAFVPRFFSGGSQTTVATDDGIEISRHMVLLMSSLSQRVATALGSLTAQRGEV